MLDMLISDASLPTVCLRRLAAGSADNLGAVRFCISGSKLALA
jgi:hypothetical protein